jgi:hypothetical protein
MASVLVVAHRTAATPALLNAIRARAARGPVRFHLLVPSPAQADWHPDHREHDRSVAEGERVLAGALPLIKEAGGWATGSVSTQHDPFDAIEDALRTWEFDEIILSTLPRSLSRWLHVDLPRRVAHLGLPLTTVIPEEARPAGSAALS